MAIYRECQHQTVQLLALGPPLLYKNEIQCLLFIGSGKIAWALKYAQSLINIVHTWLQFYAEKWLGYIVSSDLTFRVRFITRTSDGALPLYVIHSSQSWPYYSVYSMNNNFQCRTAIEEPVAGTVTDLDHSCCFL